MLPPGAHRLPGSRRLVDSLRDDLLGYGAVVMRTPSGEVSDLLFSMVADTYGEYRPVVSASIAQLMRHGTPCRELSYLLGLTQADRAVDLLEDGDLQPTVLWVDARENEGCDLALWWRLVDSMAAHERTRGHDRRMQIIVSAPPDAAGWTMRPNGAVVDRWWWGVFDRLDAVLAVTESCQASDLVTQCAVELAGFDLELAVAIAQATAGSDVIDMDHLLDYLRERGVEEFESTAGHSASPDAPHRDSVEGWRRGLIEFWDGEERTHPRAAGAAVAQVVKSRLWRGQCRALFVPLEDLRQMVGRWVSEHAHVLDPAAIDDAFERDRHAKRIEELSSGVLAHLIKVEMKGPLRTPDRVRLATRVASLRNDLAHGKPTMPDQAAHLPALAAEVRKAFAI